MDTKRKHNVEVRIKYVPGDRKIKNLWVSDEITEASRFYVFYGKAVAVRST